MNKIKSILAENNINKTKFRVDLLKLFYSKKSLSVLEIFDYFNSTVNKVTIYRSLKSFEEKCLIHKVPDSKNFTRYSLCNKNECKNGSHAHNHGHFICYACEQTFCLESIKVENTNQLDGFKVENLKLVYEGYCNSCINN